MHYSLVLIIVHSRAAVKSETLHNVLKCHMI